MKKLLLSSAVTMIASVAHGQNVGDTRLSFGASTLGATAELQYRFHSNFAVRGLAGGLVGISPSLNVDGNDYTSNLDPSGLGVLLDFYPGQSGFRLSGGALYSDPSFTAQATATAGSPLTIGGTTLSSGETIDANVSFANEISPMLSIGYDLPVGDNWVFSAEVGAVFNGGYDAGVTVSGGVVPTTDLDAEARSIEDELNRLGAYPYISLMVGMRF